MEPGGPPGESGDDGLKLTPCGLQLDDEPFTTDDACTQPVSDRKKCRLKLSGHWSQAAAATSPGSHHVMEASPDAE